MDTETPDGTPNLRDGLPQNGAAMHDLNNMLASVLAGLQLMARRHRDDERSQEIVNTSLASIRQIQDYLKTDSRKYVDRVPPTGFKHTLRGANRHPTIEDTADRHDLFFAAIEMTRMPMVVTNPNLPDNPIVFANQAFLNTTGYSMDEVLDRNCRFLRGPGTDRQAVDAIRRAIQEKTDLAVELLNYRKDGTVFWNALFLSPIFDRDGRLL